MKAMPPENKAQIYIDNSHQRIQNFRVVVLVLDVWILLGGEVDFILVFIALRVWKRRAKDLV